MKLTRANIAVTALTMIAIILTGAAASQCGRGPSRQIVVITENDSASTDTLQKKNEGQRAKKRKNPKKRQKKSERGTPSRRHYLDEAVNDSVPVI